MDTFRFGRKLSLPSTIAIKHQLRMLMADDEAKKAEEEASNVAAWELRSSFRRDIGECGGGNVIDRGFVAAIRFSVASFIVPHARPHP
jgi:hypothetical protein